MARHPTSPSCRSSRMLLVLYFVTAASLLSASTLRAEPRNDTRLDHFKRWLNSRSNPDLPFRNYGVWEATLTYARVVLFDMPPDSADTVILVRNRSPIDKLLEQRERLTNVLAKRPELQESFDKEITSIEYARTKLVDKKSALDTRMHTLTGRMDSSNVRQNVSYYNQRQKLRKERDSIIDQLLFYDSELNRLKNERQRLLLIEAQIGSIDERLEQAKTKTTYFMVSHRPLLLSILVVAVLTSLGSLAIGKKAKGSGAIATTFLATFIMASIVYSYACIMQREYLVSIPVIGTPTLAGSLLIIFGFLRWRTSDDVAFGAARVGFYSAISMVLIMTVHGLVSESAEGSSRGVESFISTGYVIAAAIGAAWVLVWASLCFILLSAVSNALFRILGVAGITGVSSWFLGAGGVGIIDGAAPVLGMSLLFGLAIASMEAHTDSWFTKVS